jgi:hypothetical protein
MKKEGRRNGGARQVYTHSCEPGTVRTVLRTFLGCSKVIELLSKAMASCRQIRVGSDQSEMRYGMVWRS